MPTHDSSSVSDASGSRRTPLGRSSDRQHDFDDRVEQEVDLGLAIAASLRRERDGAHLVDRDRPAVLEVPRELSVKRSTSRTEYPSTSGFTRSKRAPRAGRDGSRRPAPSCGPPAPGLIAGSREATSRSRVANASSRRSSAASTCVVEYPPFCIVNAVCRIFSAVTTVGGERRPRRHDGRLEEVLDLGDVVPEPDLRERGKMEVHRTILTDAHPKTRKNT